MRPRKPRNKWPKVPVSLSIDKDVKLTLDMLGFDIPELVRQYLSKVSEEGKCPCCNRKLAPVIIGRKV